ncbi:hypothetical protein ACK305_18520, partial [Aeromonas caviae]
KRMVVIRSPSPQLVPFKLYRFGQQRHSEAELSSQYDKPLIQISPAFVKDIVSRFSSYYARQGQPDIDHEKGALVKIKQKAEAQ